MDQKFNKAFWDACANGDFATVCAEIKKGADINYQNGDVVNTYKPEYIRKEGSE